MNTLNIRATLPFLASLVSTSAFHQPPASLETSLTVYQLLDKGCSTYFSSFFPKLDPACFLLSASYQHTTTTNFFLYYKSASFSLCRST
jgi:hypothetical protein